MRLCCRAHMVTDLCNLLKNSGVTVLEKLVSYGLHNPCFDLATGTGEGTCPLSHGDLRERRTRQSC